MIDWRGLEEAVVSDLDADTPRLVYADALQAFGDPRGELIAVQCELARLGAEGVRLAQHEGVGSRDPRWLVDAFETGDPVHRAELRAIEKRLLRDHKSQWSAGLPERSWFHRGFVEHVDAYQRRDPASLFDRAPALTSLVIEIPHPGSEVFAEPRMKQLRQLRIGMSGPVPDRIAVEAFLGSLSHLREYAPVDDTEQPERLFPPSLRATLEAVELVRPQPGLVDWLCQTAPRLRHLSIKKQLHDSLTAAAERLEILELDDANADIVTIARSMRRLRALRLFQVGGKFLDEEGARAIGESFPDLRMLDLDHTPMAGLIQDLTAGSGLGSLTHLRLRRCHLDDAALGHLLRSPLGHRIRHLDLTHNAITDRSVEGLVAATNLTVLEVDRTKLTKQGFEVLRAKLPHARVSGWKLVKR